MWLCAAPRVMVTVTPSVPRWLDQSVTIDGERPHVGGILLPLMTRTPPRRRLLLSGWPLTSNTTYFKMSTGQ